MNTKIIKSIFICCCLALLPLNNLFADNLRTLSISNQCDFDVLWGVAGTPIKNEGKTVACQGENTACFDGKGFCGNDSICYFKYPYLISGRDDHPDFYLSQGATKDYEVVLFTRNDVDKKPITQYQIKLGTQYQCSYNDTTETFECLSGNCARHNDQPLNGQCQPSSGLQVPYTQAEIIFNNSQNDFYNISIENGMNIPMSITPIGEFGHQKPQGPIFCKTIGGLPTGHPDNMAGCIWKFNPPNTDEIKPHVFTQIHREIDADVTVACQTDAECTSGQKCGLKYPDDLKNYHYSAYCGVPIGYYTAINICSNQDISPELQNLLKCEHVTFDQTNTETPIPVSDTDPVEIRCPNNFTTLNLTGVANSEQKFCNYELFQCNTKTFNIAGKNYKYLDSCYNYKSTDPESSTCCGCVDWPNIPSNENHLCLTAVDADPEPCNIDFGSKPPYCKKHYETLVSKPNPVWLALVKPHLQWLTDGCPDATEYKFGDRHSKIQCSSKSVPADPGNNMNYLITLCPNGKNLFSDNIKATSVTISDYDKKAFERAGITNKELEANSTDLVSIIIFIVFTLLVIILVIYYANKRNMD